MPGGESSGERAPESGEPRLERRFSGWGLVAAAALLMGAAGIYQFGWSSIRLPLGARLGAPETALGTVFTLFVTFQTLSQFPAGWVRDRYGPRIPLLAGGVGMAGGLAGVALADSFVVAAVAYALGGAGGGMVYTVAVNTPVKWFTARRGLAMGVVTTAYSGVSFLLVPGIRRGVAVAFPETVLVLAAFTGVAALVAMVVITDPGDVPANRTGTDTNNPDTNNPDTDTANPKRDGDEGGRRSSGTPSDEVAYRWRDTVRTWQFWLLYGVMVVINGVGLMLIGKIVSYATALSLPAAAATAAATVVAFADAAGLLVVGGASDRIGRRRTAAASVVLAGVALGAAVVAGLQGSVAGFVGLVAVTAFFRSPPFTVFPALVGEYYGRAYSSENYALLYTGKLFGGVFGGVVASGLVVSLGWSTTFGLGAGLLVVAGAALFLLRPVADR